MAGSQARIVRRPTAPEPVLDSAAYDYADAFELALERPDHHTAEHWARTALEGAAPLVRWFIRFVHARIVRLRLGPESDPSHVLGWRTVTSTPGLLHLEASGPLLQARIITRRQPPYSGTVATYLYYRRPVMRALWLVIGPLHRRAVPYLLRATADALTSEDVELTDRAGA